MSPFKGFVLKSDNRIKFLMLYQLFTYREPGSLKRLHNTGIFCTTNTFYVTIDVVNAVHGWLLRIISSAVKFYRALEKGKEYIP
jgi:hypothetical protein